MQFTMSYINIITNVKFYRNFKDDLLSVAWDWCVDEEEKQIAEKVWC